MYVCIMLLTEKYMPTEFNQIIENEYICNLLNDYINQNYIPHMLIHGPHGCGKSIITDILVNKYLGSYKKNLCMYVYGSINRGKNIISDYAYKKSTSSDCSDPNIIYFIKKKEIIPENKTKIIIIYDFDSMVTDTQMAFRRIIEKYTHRVKFILICNEKESIIEAIQSRVVSIGLNSITGDGIIKHLKYMVKSVKEECCESQTQSGLDVYYISDDIYKAISLISNGDMRCACNILQVFLHTMRCGYNKISDFYDLLNQPSIETIIRIIQLCDKHDLRNSINELQNLLLTGYNTHDILSIILRTFMYEILFYNNEKKKKIFLSKLIDTIYKSEIAPSDIHIYSLICEWVQIE